jgi:polyhydroxybutyrate depolymerase
MSFAATGRSRIVLGGALAAFALLPAWAAVFAVEVARSGLSHSLEERPDRLFGWEGAPNQIAVTLLTCVAAVLLGTLAPAVAARGRRSRSSLAAAGLLLVAAAGEAAIQIFPAGPHGYEESQLRGWAALTVAGCLPAAALAGAVAMNRSGRPWFGWLSAAAGAMLGWAGAWAGLISASAGSLQPSLDAAAVVEALAPGWLALLGLWLLDPKLPSLPRPESAAALPAGARRLAGLAVCAAAILAIVVNLAPYARTLGPTFVDQMTGRTRVESISVAGVGRWYRVHRPDRLAARPGLVIVLHGVFGSGFRMEENTGFDVEADRLGWLVAYPDGVLDGWDAYGSTDWWGRHPGADDVAFIAALIDHLETTDAVDPGRVFVTGLSRGAMMTYRLGCELADRIAAIAPVAGNMADSSGSAEGAGCHPTRPVSLLAIHGTADVTIPIDGGHVDIDYAPMADVIAVWRGLDGCSADSSTSTDGASTTTSWSCAGGTTVATRIVRGGWHTWPGGPPPPEPPGNRPDNFDASRLIADFFEAHAR